MAVQQARLEVAMGDLATAQAQLDEKEAELAAVQADYDKAMSEKQVGLHAVQNWVYKVQGLYIEVFYLLLYSKALRTL